MSTSAIRASLAAVLAGVTGIQAAFAYPPDSVGALPMAFCGLNDRALDYTAGLEVNDHTLTVIVLIERTAGMLPQGLARLEVTEEAFIETMRSHTGLPTSGGVRTVTYCQITRIQQDTVRIGQVDYLGFVATLGIHDKYGVSLT